MTGSVFGLALPVFFKNEYKRLHYNVNLEVQFNVVDPSWVERSALFRELAAEHAEILRHKWLESEKAGRDVGFENAVMNWVIHHRAQWRQSRRQPDHEGSELV